MCVICRARFFVGSVSRLRAALALDVEVLLTSAHEQSRDFQPPEMDDEKRDKLRIVIAGEHRQPAAFHVPDGALRDSCSPAGARGVGESEAKHGARR